MTLNDRMEFDYVIYVDENGHVHDTDVYAPSLFEDELDGPEWSLMNGYSGQDRYSGPIMHASEFIGGALERDILAQPGYYVCLVNELDNEDGYAEGWAVAFKESL